MEVEIIDSFIGATKNVIETMTSLKVLAGEPYKKEGKNSFGEVTGMIGMIGDNIQGNMIVSFEESTILKIVNSMLCEKYVSINSYVVDAVGEITNMICGGTKNGLSGMGMNVGMASPVMLVGKAQLSQLKNVPVIVIPFSTEAGQFVVEANIVSKN